MISFFRIVVEMTIRPSISPIKIMKQKPSKNLEVNVTNSFGGGL